MGLFVTQCVALLALPAMASATLSAGTSGSGRRFLQDEEPIVGYSALPGTPSEEMVVEQNAAAQTADGWAATGKAASALHYEAAENMEAAAQSELITEAQGLKMKGATMAAVLSAQRAAEMHKRAEASVKRSRAMVAEMPGVALKAAGRAIDAVVKAAVLRMDQDATDTVNEQKRLERRLAREASKAAQLAALPWQQAKLRASQEMVSYLSQGRDLANAVTELKLQSPKLAVQAGILQKRGNVVQAQEYMIAAHDLMDKAGQLAAQANSFNGIANKINAGIGMYDLSASAAASYASYTANPGGGMGGMPPLPHPLALIPPPKPVAAGPGPAPAPAAAASSN